MITADRFLAESTDRAAWLAARELRVTATEVAKASTPVGFEEAVTERRNHTEVLANDYMKFGSDHEHWIALDVKRRFGIMPNLWLIEGERPQDAATPDGLSLDHSTIAEIKTGGTIPKAPPAAHRRQMQWQMWVTGAERCLYAFMHRIQVNGIFVPAWMEPETQWVERDDTEISKLIAVADRLLETQEAAA